MKMKMKRGREEEEEEEEESFNGDDYTENDSDGSELSEESYESDD